MTDHKLEPELSTWLTEGPQSLPTDVRRQILVSVHLLRQQRVAGLFGWPARSGRALVAPATAVALIAVAALGWSLWGRQAIGPAPSASPSPRPVATSPAASATVSPSATVRRFSSPVYVYSTQVPSDWAVTPATLDWGGPKDGTEKATPPYADLFTSGDATVSVAAKFVAIDVTSASWLRYWQGQREVGGRCLGAATPWMETTVARFPASYYQWRCEATPISNASYDEYAFVANGEAFVINGSPAMVQTIIEAFSMPIVQEGPTAPPRPGWSNYSSSQYGFNLDYPTGWSVAPAARDWSLEKDPADTSSPAMDTFTSPDGEVRVSAWTVPVDETTIPVYGDEAALRAWIDAYCAKTGNSSCGNILEGAIPLCIEIRDCHPGLLVVAPGHDVQAFAGGGIYSGQVVVVVVWAEASDPALARYGGAQQLIEGFLPAGIFPAPTSP